MAYSIDVRRILENLQTLSILSFSAFPEFVMLIRDTSKGGLVDLEKCENCPIPISHCDGMTRYKCGTERKDVQGHCIYDRYMRR